MSSSLRQQLERLPELLSQHLQLSLIALACGILISVPTALALSRSPRASGVVLAGCGVIQTVPGLALLALMVPLLGAFGFLPALLALTLYSLLPMLRNALTGLLGVDPAVCEAAVGLGMTPRQVLLEVRLPLAAPVVLAGIRTAAVWVVGMATLSTPVGQASLGNYIFAGLQTRNWTAVLVGCVAAAGLAMALDALLAGTERAVTQRRPALFVGVGSGLAVLLAAALWPLLAPERSTTASPPSAPTSNSSNAGGAAAQKRQDTPSAEQRGARVNAAPYRIGAKTFTEQYVLSALLDRRLRAAGLDTERIESLGSSVVFDALVQGEIDVYVDYTGTLWANHMKKSANAPSWHVLHTVSGWLASQHGIRLLGKLGFENAYALAMRKQQARSLGELDTISALSPHATQLSLGSDYEFFDRPEWRTLKSSYDLDFRERRSFDSSFMYAAVRDGEVDVITAFTSDGRIDAFDLAVLTDDRGAFPPYDAVILMSQRAAARAVVVQALEPLIDSLPVSLMRKANARVDNSEHAISPEAAAEWLDRQLL